MSAKCYSGQKIHWKSGWNVTVLEYFKKNSADSRKRPPAVPYFTGSIIEKAEPCPDSRLLGCALYGKNLAGCAGRAVLHQQVLFDPCVQGAVWRKHQYLHSESTHHKGKAAASLYRPEAGEYWVSVWIRRTALFQPNFQAGRRHYTLWIPGKMVIIQAAAAMRLPFEKRKQYCVRESDRKARSWIPFLNSIR